MIIGITGTMASGKDTLAEYLIKKNFFHFSLSDTLRKELKKRNMPIDRDAMVKFANDFREEKGFDILARLAIEEIKNSGEKNAVITSIRNPKEAEYLKKYSDFKLIAIDAPIKKRYKRIRLRQREGDEVSFDKFKIQEETEMTGGAGKQNIGAIMQMADFTIINDGTIEELYTKIEKIL